MQDRGGRGAGGEDRERADVADAMDDAWVDVGAEQVADEVRRHHQAEHVRRKTFEPAAHREQRTEQARSEEHTSELQSLMRNSYAVFCLTKKNNQPNIRHT